MSIEIAQWVAPSIDTGSVKKFPHELDKTPDILERANDSKRDSDSAGSLAVDALAKIFLGEAWIFFFVLTEAPYQFRL